MGTDGGVSDIKRFVKDAAEWDRERRRIKQYRCPHCLIRGTLTGHGCLYGYRIGASVCHIRKGFRVLCSNRYRYRGCGRTASIWFAWVLRRCMVGAHDMWQFVQRLANNERCYTAARQVLLATSVASPYRWKASLERAQINLRLFLQPHIPVSASHRSLRWPWLLPYDQLREHAGNDAIQWFQYRFQTSLFPP